MTKIFYSEYIQRTILYFGSYPPKLHQPPLFDCIYEYYYQWRTSIIMIFDEIYSSLSKTSSVRMGVFQKIYYYQNHVIYSGISRTILY